jgi:hypothetical protein
MATNIAVTDNKALLSGNGLSAPRSVFGAQCFVLGEVEITKSVSVCTSAEQEISRPRRKPAQHPDAISVSVLLRRRTDQRINDPLPDLEQILKEVPTCNYPIQPRTTARSHRLCIG